MTIPTHSPGTKKEIMASQDLTRPEVTPGTRFNRNQITGL
jgi:hypothetical protein